MLQFTEQLKVGPWFLRERSSFAKQSYRGQPTTVEVSLAMGFAGSTMVELIQQHMTSRPSIARSLRGEVMACITGVWLQTASMKPSPLTSRSYEIGFAAEPTPSMSPT